MVIIRYHVSGNCQRSPVVITVSDRHASMLNRSDAIHLTSCKDETPVKKPTQKCMSGTVIGLEAYSLLKQRDRHGSVFCHLAEKRWQYSQYKIVGAEAVGPFPSDAIN